MNQSKRNFLKMLPMAALTGTAITVAGREGRAHELKPHKKYLFVVPEMRPDEAKSASRFLREQRGIDATIITSNADMAIYELDA